MEAVGTVSGIAKNGSSGGREGICVGIRMRPLNEREISNGQDKIFRCINDRNAISQVKDSQLVEGQTYHYDKVFDERSSTVEVYSHIGRDIVQGVMNGINGTIFACKGALLFDTVTV